MDVVDDVLDGCLEVTEGILAEGQLKPGLPSAGNDLALLVGLGKFPVIDFEED